MKSWLIISIGFFVVLAGFLIFAKKDVQAPTIGIPTGTTTQSSTTGPASGGTPSIGKGTIPPSPPAHGSPGIVEGIVQLGPTCPVERIPPEPQCAPKPYATIIRIQPLNPSAPYTSIRSDTSGAFKVSLYAGTYTFAPTGGNSMPPTCRSQQVIVTAGEKQDITLDCDTGIR